MSNQTSTITSAKAVKYTTILPRDSISELRRLADRKIIPSINQGIRIAVEDFVKASRLKEYERGVLAAATDEAFIKRTMDAQQAFEAVDSEVFGQW
jgi:hypothetical protein